MRGIVPGYTRYSSSFSGRYNKRPRGSGIIPTTEMKFHDDKISPTDGGNSWVDLGGWASGATLGSLNLIAVGAGPSQRIGRKITVRNILANIGFNMAAHQSDFCRVSIILDKQCNGSEPTAAELFEGTNLFQFSNPTNNKRFQTLYQKTFAMNFTATGITASNAVPPVVQAYHNGQTKKVLQVKLKTNITIDYSTAVGTADIADVRTNNIILVFQGAESKVQVTGFTRCIVTGKQIGRAHV